MSKPGAIAAERILDRATAVLNRTTRADPQRIRELFQDLDENGQWPDIDYTDQKRGNWEPWQHTSRLRDLSHALVQNLPGAPDRDPLEQSILRALDHWLENRYRAPNWWHNQIGIPRDMRDVAILLRGRLDGVRWNGLVEVVGQHRMRGEGANLLWSAELALHYGCLVSDPGVIAEAAERIRAEITVGRNQGIQEDWSFRQHGPRLMSYSYGHSYAGVAIVTGWQLRGTPWEYGDEEIAILSNYFLEGLQWMQRSGYTVPSTMDRRATRPGALHADLEDWLELWAEVDEERRRELKAFRERLQRQREPIDGFRHFPKADFTVYHRPDFSFFVKTVSNRTHLTESINNENLLGHHLNTGDHYFVRTGEEYFDLMPVWDWEKLPGLTHAPGLGPIARQPFVGGLGDKRSGLAAMDLRKTGDDGAELRVNRTWFFHDDFAVALLGGWDLSGTEVAPYTVLDQSRLLGDVVVVGSGGETRDLGEGEHRLEQPLAILHGDVAWLPIGAASTTVRVGPAGGSWQRINGNHSGERVVEPLFLAWMTHGRAPQPGSFAVAPGLDAEQARRLAAAAPWEVLCNNQAIQAIQFDDSTAMAALFEPGQIEFGGGRFSSSVPCLVLWNGENLLLADPTGNGVTAKIRWRGTARQIELPANGMEAQLKPGSRKVRKE